MTANFCYDLSDLLRVACKFFLCFSVTRSCIFMTEINFDEDVIVGGEERKLWIPSSTINLVKILLEFGLNEGCDWAF